MSLGSILQTLSIDRAWQHMTWLQEHAPARISGSEDDRRAAEYFMECLTSYGLEAQLDTFTAYRSFPLRGELSIVAPAPMEIPCEGCAHIASTPDEGVEAELVFVGPGGVEDYQGKDVHGKIVLAEISYAPPRPEKGRIAAQHGAAAIIFMNWGLAEHPTIPRGAIKSVWGNPTRAMMPQIPQIPAIGISRAAGEALCAQLEQGPVQARLVAQATRDWGPLWQPWARLKADSGQDEFLLVGGHYDAWEPGMTDNASGNALTLELARVFSQHQDALQRDIVFIFWNGHEIGDMEGSSWYVDNYWDQLNAHCAAYFNIDTVGMIETTRYVTAASPELRRFHQQVEQQILGAPGEKRRLTRIGDQSFFGIGIPSIYSQFYHSLEKIKAWHNATLGWWWHSAEDTLDKVDPTRYRQTMDVYAAYIWETCTRDMLPMEFVTVAEELTERTLQMQKIAGDKFELDLPLTDFSQAAANLDRLIDVIQKDNRHQELSPLANQTLMQLSRILTPAFSTVGGRYTQDSYGLTALQAPIPVLAELNEFVQTPPDSEPHHLLLTELTRKRNRLADAVTRATATIQTLLKQSEV